MRKIIAIIALISLGTLLSACDFTGCENEPVATDTYVQAHTCNLVTIPLWDMAFDQDEDDHLVFYFGPTYYGELMKWNGSLAYLPYDGAEGTERVWFYVEDDCEQESHEATLLISVDCW